MLGVHRLTAICGWAGTIGLGQTSPQPFSIAMWSAVLISSLVALFAGVSAFRRWMNRDEESVSLGFTLGDLRALHRQGQMTDEEFERAKAQMIGQAKRDAITALKSAGMSGQTAPPAARGHDSSQELAAYARALQAKAERERLEAESPPDPPTEPPPGDRA